MQFSRDSKPQGSWSPRSTAIRACLFAGAAFFLGVPTLRGGIPFTEHTALVDLYASTNGVKWTNSTGWATAVDECSWYGVSCDSEHTTVISLDLSGNHLSGGLPSSLADVSNLESLNLSDNQLTGSIPSQLATLAHLRYVIIHNNQLSGPLPPVEALPHLLRLDLRDNAFSGPISASLGSVATLQFLLLRNNQLSGSIPPQLGNLINLQQLELGGNQLTGTIPAELGNLANLLSLGLNDNQLSGSIPSEIGKLSSLLFLALHRNQLNGTIPPELGSLSSLLQLFLFDNQLTGSIPSQLGNLTALQLLDLNGNRLSGSIPTTLIKLTSLVQCDLRWNALYSTDATLSSRLNAAQTGGDWQSTQTTAPTNVTVLGTASGSVTLGWTPIAYTTDAGYYTVSTATVPGGPYTRYTTATAGKSDGSLTVSGLQPAATYFFVVDTTTLPHAGNLNAVTSGFSVEVSAQAAPPPTGGCQPLSAASGTISFHGQRSGCSASGGNCRVGEAIVFTLLPANGYDLDCGAASYVWNFGDGSLELSASAVTHAYTTPATFTVSARVSNSGGTATFAQLVRVVSAPARRRTVVPPMPPSSPLLDGASLFDGTFPMAAAVPWVTPSGAHLVHPAAYPGFLILIVDPATSQATVASAVAQVGGSIVGMLPSLGQYLVRVAAGAESPALTALYPNGWLRFAGPASAAVRGSASLDWDDPEELALCGQRHGTYTTNIMNRRRAGAARLVDVSHDAIDGQRLQSRLLTEIEAEATSHSRSVLNVSLRSRLDAAYEGSAGNASCVSIACDAVREGERLFLAQFFQSIEEMVRRESATADNTIVTIIAGNAGVSLDAEIGMLKSSYPEAFKRIVIVGGALSSGAIDLEFNHFDGGGTDMVYARSRNVETGEGPLCDGTSFAAPEVASVLDAIWARAPGRPADQIVAAFRDALGDNPVLPTDNRGRTTQSFVDAAVAKLNTPQPMATIRVIPSQMSFTGVSGQSDPLSQSLTITNTGTAGSTLNCTVDVNAAWIALSGQPAALGAGQSAQLDVTASIAKAGLPQSGGTVSGIITVSDPQSTNKSQTVPVSLVMSGANSYDGPYSGGYSGTFTPDSSAVPPFAVSGPVVFTVADGVMTLSQPGPGQASISSTGAVTVSGSGTISSQGVSYVFQGTFALSGSGSTVTGTWTASNTLGSAQGTWSAQRQ